MSRKKILLILLIGLAVLVLIPAGAGLFLYYQPDRVKGLVERTVSRFLKGDVSIRTLKYSTGPLRVEAEGITLRSEDGGLTLDIPRFSTAMTYSGPFGGRRVTIDSLRLRDLQVHLETEHGRPELIPRRRPSSWLSRMLNRVVAFLFLDDVVLESAALSGAVAVHLPDQRLEISDLKADLTREHLEVTCRIEARWPGKEMTLAASRVRLQSGEAVSLFPLKLGGRIRLHKGLLEGPGISARNLQLETQFRYEHPEKTLQLRDISLAATAVSESLGDPGDLSIDLQGDASLGLKDGAVEITAFTAAVADTAMLQGEIRGRFTPSPEVDLTLRDSWLAPSRLNRLLPRTSEQLPIQMGGRLEVSGTLKGMRSGTAWKWHADGRGGLEGNSIRIQARSFELASRLSGEVRVRGNPLQPELSVRLRSQQTRIRAPNLDMLPFHLKLSARGTFPALALRDGLLKAPGAAVHAGAKELGLENIEVVVPEGTVDLLERSVSIPRAQMSSSRLKGLFLSLSAKGQTFGLDMEGKDLGLMPALAGWGLLPAGWTFDGEDSLHLHASRQRDGRWSYHGRLDVREFGFHNPPETFLGEQLVSSLTLEGEMDPGFSELTGTGRLQVSDGEALFHRFYLNFSQTPFSAKGDLHYGVPEQSLRTSDLSLGLKDLITVLVHEGGWKDSTGLSVTATIPRTAVKPMTAKFLVEPFQAEKPFLSQMDLAGSVSGDFIWNSDGEGWTVAGTCSWDQGELTHRSGGMGVEGIDLDLPFTLSNRPGAIESQPPSGTLSIRSVRMPFVPPQPVQLTLRPFKNGWSVKEDTDVETEFGAVRLGPVSAALFEDALLNLETRLMVSELDLAPLLSRFWHHPVEGTLTGELDRVGLNGTALMTSGDLEANLFGGTVTLYDIGGSGVMTATPLYRLSARLDAIHLGELTRDTPFGRIRGILNGTIEDLELAYGQPQQFELFLETVKKDGVPQRISVKAVENISRIGGGRSPFMGLAGAMTIFFKEFPYEKIGIRASLENDIFRINGTIHEDGTEYFVKKGGLSGVNIVNQNPENRASFKDMLKRIQRVTSSHRGPVIK